MENRFAEFTLLVSNVTRAINKIKNVEMAKFGLKGTQVNCLFYIYTSNASLSAKDICVMCEEDKAAVSRSLKELEQSGYLVSSKEEGKRKYNSVLSLTEKGKEIGSTIITKIEEILNYKDGYLSNEELKSFYSTFGKIYKHLKEVSEKCEDK